MARTRYFKAGLVGLIACLLMSAAVEVAFAEEENWFPLCLWAVFSDYPENQDEWDAERMCLDSIDANWLEGCVPHPDTVLDYLCDNRGYWLTVEGLPYERLDVRWSRLWYRHVHHPDSAGWPDSVSDFIQEMYDVYGSHSGLGGYLIAHEGVLRDSFYYPGMDTVCQMIDSIDANADHWSIAYDFIWNVDSTFFDAVPNLDVFRHGSFPFDLDLPYSGQEFQDRLDAVVSGYQMCFESFKGRHTEWQAHIQVGAWSGTSPHRRPTEREIRVQTWLALSRGTKGLSYFPYLSDLTFEGLVTPNCPRQPVLYYFDYVAHLNQDLRVIGPIMRRLECTDAFPADDIPPEIYIKSVAGTTYVEVGTFVGFHYAGYSPKDTIIPVPPLQTDYFMLVNRHCLPQDTVTLTVTIEKEGTWFCRDMFTGQDTVLVSDASGKFYYTTVVGPGDGCLVLLKKAKYGLVPRDIWYEYEYIAGDVTVPDTGLIIVEPGTLIKAVPGSDNQCHGVDSTLSEIIVEGTFVADAGWIAGADTIIFTSAADTTRSGDWFGIRFRPGSSGSVRKCVIEYGYTGLEAVGANLSPIRQNNIRDTTMRMPGLS